jgi:hypothetical protein
MTVLNLISKTPTKHVNLAKNTVWSAKTVTLVKNVKKTSSFSMTPAFPTALRVTMKTPAQENANLALMTVLFVLNPMSATFAVTTLTKKTENVLKSVLKVFSLILIENVNNVLNTVRNVITLTLALTVTLHL